ncbi:lipase family protein [Enterobacteriaceae bacterium ESL0689]|nr:lipase family protein [Enterobacteriaceae bacterium ESL0689]
MGESRTSAVGAFGKAEAQVQRKCWIEIQLVDENSKPVANMPWRVENEATRDKYLEPYQGITDSEGILRIDNLYHPDLTLFVAAQPLADEMEQRPLSIERTTVYAMKMASMTVDKQTNYICYYVVIGQLCDKAPEIPDWESEALPFFHFPDPDFSGLTISNMHFNSRVIVKICPFRAWNLLLHHTKEYSIINAYNLGLLAEFAYESEEKITNFFNKECQDLSWVPSLLYQTISVDVPFRQRYIDPRFLDTSAGSAGEGGTQLFYVHNKKQMIISWRGTELTKWNDIKTDVSFRPVPCGDIISGGRAHKGFLDAYRLAVYKFSVRFNTDIPRLCNERELFISGHSLGGALSLIQATVLRTYNPLLYTYGMPRVFCAATIAQLDDIIHFRHVNDSDTITSVPPENELENNLYNLWGPFGIICGVNISVAELIAQNVGIKFGDPYWHHGNIVIFFKAEQSFVKKITSLPAGYSLDEMNTNPLVIRNMFIKKAKLFVVPLLNEHDFKEATRQQERFIKRIDKKSLEKYFPKNTNPELDSFTNLLHHLMTGQYMPYLKNQLLELVDPERKMERKQKRLEFAQQVEKAATTGEHISKEEASRNKILLLLQDMLPETLAISKSAETWQNSLIRFKNREKEEHE